MSQRPRLRIVVKPEPTDREKAAIAAAIVAMSGNVPDDDPTPPVNKWREAGKREALRDSMWEKNS